MKKKEQQAGRITKTSTREKKVEKRCGLEIVGKE